jgi:hypothetical protein
VKNFVMRSVNLVGAQCDVESKFGELKRWRKKGNKWEREREVRRSGVFVTLNSVFWKICFENNGHRSVIREWNLLRPLVIMSFGKVNISRSSTRILKGSVSWPLEWLCECRRSCY